MNLFVGVGHNGLRIVSPDGQQWSGIQTGKEGEVYRAVCFGNGLCAVAGSYGGSNIFAATRDGKAWATAAKDAMYSKYVRGMVFARNQFYGIGGDPGSVGNSNPFETHSPDGITWTEYQTFPGKNMLRRVAYGAQAASNPANPNTVPNQAVFVGVGDRGRRAVSSDMRDWKDAPDTRALDTLVDVSFGNGVWVGVGLNGLRMRTRDGLKWTDKQMGEEGEHLNSILWTGERFVAVGMGATYTSPNGAQWKRESNENAPLTATYGAGVFVGTAWKGRLLRSTDAIVWKEVFKCDHHVQVVGFGEMG